MNDTITLDKVEYYQMKHTEKLKSFIHGFIVGATLIIVMLFAHQYIY